MTCSTVCSDILISNMLLGLIVTCVTESFLLAL